MDLCWFSWRILQGSASRCSTSQDVLEVFLNVTASKQPVVVLHHFDIHRTDLPLACSAAACQLTRHSPGTVPGSFFHVESKVNYLALSPQELRQRHQTNGNSGTSRSRTFPGPLWKRWHTDALAQRVNVDGKTNKRVHK